MSDGVSGECGRYGMLDPTGSPCLESATPLGALHVVFVRDVRVSS